MVTFQFPRILEKYCGGHRSLQVKADTVRELLAEIRNRHPALYECLCTETGAVRQHLHLFVNNDLISGRQELDAPVTERDVVSVFQAVSGG